MKDLKNAAMYVCTGVIIDIISCSGIAPTVKEMRMHWHSEAWKMLLDEDIQALIDIQKRYI